MDRARARRAEHRLRPAVYGDVRFAFYGRMSTEDFQDLGSSLRWQREVAQTLVVNESAEITRTSRGSVQAATQKDCFHT